MQEPRIRLAAEADLDAIAEVETSAAEAFASTPHANAPDCPPWDLDVYRSRIAAGTAWVAQFEGEIAGSLVAEAMPDALHLCELAVRFSHQRRGLGRKLVLTAVACARALQLPAVTLTTFRNVSFNAPFYRSLGFALLVQPPRRLAAILETEAACGLRDRCAMSLALIDQNRA